MFLLRHGQSEFNVRFSTSRIDPGIEDPRLTALGWRQAHRAADLLSGRSITRIVASPYTRALQTAAPLAARLGVAVEVDPLIRERRHFACDVGSQVSALRADWPEIDFAHLPERWWPEASESENQLATRCAAFWLRLHRATDWGETVFVSHWGFIRGLTGLAVDNGTIVSLCRQRGAEVVHLPET